MASACSLLQTRMPSPGHRALMYHAVGSAVSGDTHGLFSIAPGLFAEHMAWLKTNHAPHVVRFENGQSDTRAFRVSITFDDGYMDNLTNALPILERYELPFTIFIATDLVSNGASNFLCLNDIKTLSRHPLITIGAHGKTHTPLTHHGIASLKYELSESRKLLQDITGKAVVTMSYPHGAVNDVVQHEVKAAGYACAASSYFGVNDNDANLFCLKRTEITGADSLKIFTQKITGNWDWYRFIEKDYSRA